MDQEIGGVLLFTLIVASGPILFFYYRYRTRMGIQQTIRTAIDKGQELSPALIEKLMEPPSPKADPRLSDLRRGCIAVALGIAITLMGTVIGGEWVGPGLAIGILPLMVGLAYIGLWKFASRG